MQFKLINAIVCLLLISSHTIGPWRPKFGMGSALGLQQVKALVVGPNGPFGRDHQYCPKIPYSGFGVKEAFEGKKL